MSEGHPNLSDDLNEKIAEMERNGGIWLKDVAEGQTVLVQTANTLYTLVNHGDHWTAQGGSRFERPRIVNINGSTFGGSMIRVGFIGIGMYLELSMPGDRDDGGERGTITSPIVSAEIKGEPA